MRTYGQLCAVAGALDIVGDRWNLLVVRELLITPLLRFTDLQRGLPGIAPNLLSQRLRDLEANGVVRRDSAVPPAAGILYGLTERGVQLEGVVRELLKWGSASVMDAPPEAAFQMHWLGMPARYLARDNDPGAPEAVIRFGTPADGFDLLVGSGEIVVSPCDVAASPRASIDGPGPVLVGLLQGAIPLATAITLGVTIQGDRRVVERVLPSGEDPSSSPASRDGSAA
jgi:DNA-binding HxlR family transcriptional regulator